MVLTFLFSNYHFISCFLQGNKKFPVVPFLWYRIPLYLF